MSILKFVFENSQAPKKPIGTKITHSSGKTYVKESTGWYNVKTGNKLDYKSSLILEADGLSRNSITFTEKPDGYYMNGMKLTPEQAAPFTNYERVGGNWYNKKTGTAIYSEDNRELDKKAASLLNKLYQEHDEKEAEPDSSTDTSTQDETSSDNETSNEESSNDEEPAQSNDETSEQEPEDTAQPQPEPEESESSSTEPDNSSIPNGYVYTSGKGNKFVLKNGTWINAGTKKPVNQSNVNMLTRSALKSISDYNSKNDIKIGSKVTSNKGVEYTFTGTGFVSSDGKQLSGGAAQSAMKKLKEQNPSNNSSEQGNTTEPEQNDSTEPNNSPEPADTIVPGESALDTQANDQNASDEQSSSSDSEQSSDYNAQSIINNLNSDDNTSSDSNSSTSGTETPPSNNSSEPTSGNSEDPMTKLAKQIKSNKYNKQIITLLTRGGDMDLLAADILLNGNIQEVIEQLKSLNNSNTQ